MTAKYQLFKNPRSVLKEDREHNLYPRIVKSRTITMEEMCKHISASSTFTTADILGAWAALKREIIEELKDGNRVELDGLGNFSVILKCRDIKDPKEIRAESIEFSKVSFIPSKKLHRELKGMTVERQEERNPYRIEPQEIRLKRIVYYLQQNKEITSSVCARLNACSIPTARKDLKRLYDSGQLVCHGGMHVSIYTLHPDIENI